MISLPAELKPEQLTAIVDTREQLPLNLDPLQVTEDTLTTGDYSLVGLEHLIAIERKSLPDLIGCCGRERERFERELQRLQAYPTACLVIESSWAEIDRGQWRSKIKVATVRNSLISWTSRGLPIALVDDHERAGQFVARLLFTTAKRHYGELRSLIASTELVGAE